MANGKKCCGGCLLIFGLLEIIVFSSDLDVNNIDIGYLYLMAFMGIIFILPGLFFVLKGIKQEKREEINFNALVKSLPVGLINPKSYVFNLPILKSGKLGLNNYKTWGIQLKKKAENEGYLNLPMTELKTQIIHYHMIGNSAELLCFYPDVAKSMREWVMLKDPYSKTDAKIEHHFFREFLKDLFAAAKGDIKDPTALPPANGTFYILSDVLKIFIEIEWKIEEFCIIRIYCDNPENVSGVAIAALYQSNFSLSHIQGEMKKNLSEIVKKWEDVINFTPNDPENSSRIMIDRINRIPYPKSVKNLNGLAKSTGLLNNAVNFELYPLFMRYHSEMKKIILVPDFIDLLILKLQSMTDDLKVERSESKFNLLSEKFQLYIEIRLNNKKLMAIFDRLGWNIKCNLSIFTQNRGLCINLIKSIANLYEPYSITIDLNVWSQILGIPIQSSTIYGDSISRLLQLKRDISKNSKP